MTWAGSSEWAIANLCPNGHDDRTTLGYCRAEVHAIIARLCAEQADRSARGDIQGARYSGRHIQRAWSRLTLSEQVDYAEAMDAEAYTD